MPKSTISKITANHSGTKKPAKSPIQSIVALLKALGPFLVAVLGAIGAFLLVLNQIGVFPKATVTPAPTSPGQAVTLTAVLPTQDSALPTVLPVGTPTDNLPVLTPTRDNEQTELPDECLPSQEWQFYPEAAVNQEACLNLIPYFIAYDDERFDFSAQGFKEINVYGVSRPLPLKATIEATITVDELTGGGRLWLGIASEVDPLKESLMFVILPDRYVSVWGLSNGNSHEVLTRMPVKFFYDQPKKNYLIRLEMNNNRVNLFVNGANVRSTTIDFPNRRLFLGYQAVRDTKLSVVASLFNLSIR